MSTNPLSPPSKPSTKLNPSLSLTKSIQKLPQKNKSATSLHYENPTKMNKTPSLTNTTLINPAKSVASLESTATQKPLVSATSPSNIAAKKTMESSSLLPTAFSNSSPASASSPKSSTSQNLTNSSAITPLATSVTPPSTNPC
ncbi:hypothetical protein Ccrd_017067 [Cynara cardunculus var. scolymus]|uniref:Uncharacterized protein n=2 Tax=Cynara cardunculus var. scolymus TaxID=59895 RepID=A0A103Y8S5_CYNCS|nr:hypothetical protein Ccrd_017067 [Cynara cardunculus var. scolymus]